MENFDFSQNLCRDSIHCSGATFISFSFSCYLLLSLMVDSTLILHTFDSEKKNFSKKIYKCVQTYLMVKGYECFDLAFSILNLGDSACVTNVLAVQIHVIAL